MKNSRKKLKTRLTQIDFSIPLKQVVFLLLCLYGLTQAEVLTELVGANRQQIGMQGGTLEMSNVNLSKEMTELIQTQRSYQFNARTVTLADQMLGLINGIR